MALDDLHELTPCHDGRPRVDQRTSNRYGSKWHGDKLLKQLLRVHGEPRYDIAPDLDRNGAD